MNEQLQNTIRSQLELSAPTNPAFSTLLDDYTKYHAVLALLGGIVLAATVVLSVLLWVRFKRSPKSDRSKWSFEKKVYFWLAIVCTLFAVFMSLIVTANLSTTLQPRPGFAGLVESHPNNSTYQAELNNWLESGKSAMPPGIQNAVQDRLSWQRPKAIICALLFTVFVGVSVRMWQSLIRASRIREPKNSKKRAAMILLASTTTLCSLLLLIMVLANTQASLAPITITVFGAGG